MQYKRTQFTDHYYRLWEMGLLIPTPAGASVYSVKFRKNKFDEYSRVTLKAESVSDALERACYAITYTSPWRPEDIDLHAVYDQEENLLWIDEAFYQIVQKKNEFRGMERREFLAKFGMTSAAILFGLKPMLAKAGTTTTALSGTASGFVVVGEQLYTTAGTYNWSVPTGVTSCSVVCVGGGGGGGNGDGYYAGNGAPGGSLRYKNNISVTAGTSIQVVAGAGGLSVNNSVVAGGNSTFDGTTLRANGGWNFSPAAMAIGGGIGGGNGGSYTSESGGNGGGGGGAGGYSGNGGSAQYSTGEAGNGGGGGGGCSGNGGEYQCSGGGVGLYGQGANGAGALQMGGVATSGSGGGAVIRYAQAGSYGGGGAGGSFSGGGVKGGSGAVRIIWGTGRSFPSNAS